MTSCFLPLILNLQPQHESKSSEKVVLSTDVRTLCEEPRSCIFVSTDLCVVLLSLSLSLSFLFSSDFDESLMEEASLFLGSIETQSSVGCAVSDGNVDTVDRRKGDSSAFFVVPLIPSHLFVFLVALDVVFLISPSISFCVILICARKRFFPIEVFHAVSHQISIHNR